MKAEVAVLRDAASGAEAHVLVSQGFNLFRWTAMPEGKPLEVLYAPAEFETGQLRPSKGGIPLLFPFPGRIAGTTFTWEGKQHELEPGDAFGNAIHGFVMWRPWRVIEKTENKIVGQFQASCDDPSLKARWPADFRITATYSLSGNALSAEYLMENPGETPLPCGFGSHPYFRVPLGGVDAAGCVVTLPVEAKWELVEMLPTGKKLKLAEAVDYQSGKAFGGLHLDDVFSDLTFHDGWTTTTISDPQSGRSIVQRFNDLFRECVVFTPPHREAICIEPYTCVPGGFGLGARGIDAGMRVLQPGESFMGRVEIVVQ
ncbi:MAG TPA: aldose 1-epimerase [Pirellulaceae bacterium]|jgi:aldose 1-epimerase